jgi:hypothetical protein
MRSRRLSVRRPSPTIPVSAIAALDHLIRLRGDRTVRIDVVRRAEIERVDISARHEGGEVDSFRAFDVERLQLLWRERDELSAVVLVAFPHLATLDLRAAVRIMRAQRDPGGWSQIFRLIGLRRVNRLAARVRTGSGCSYRLWAAQHGRLLGSAPTPDAGEPISCVSWPATDRPGRKRATAEGSLSNSHEALSSPQRLVPSQRCWVHRVLAPAVVASAPRTLASNAAITSSHSQRHWRGCVATGDEARAASCTDRITRRRGSRSPCGGRRCGLGRKGIVVSPLQMSSRDAEGLQKSPRA